MKRHFSDRIVEYKASLINHNKLSLLLIHATRRKISTLLQPDKVKRGRLPQILSLSQVQSEQNFYVNESSSKCLQSYHID